MSVRECIDRAVEAGELDAERAKKVKSLLDELEAELVDQMGPDGAAMKARELALSELEAQTQIKRRQSLIAIHHAQRLSRQLQAAQDKFGLADKSELALLTVDAQGQAQFGIRGAEQERKIVRASAHGRMSEVLATFKRDLLGRTTNKAKLVNVVREAFGEASGDSAARELAAAWQETAEFLRLQFNAAGGHIAKLERWGLPQASDTLQVRDAGFETWRDFVLPRLDRARMKDHLTGRPLSDGRMEALLRDAYETLKTDGWNKVTPSRAGGGKAIASRHADHRFLHFKSADDWLAYQDRFGAQTDAFSAMMAHIDTMARDIGAMRALGPNPAATVRWLQQTVRREAHIGDQAGKAFKRATNTAERKAVFLDSLYGQYMGSVNRPADSRIGRGFSGLRSFLTAAQLGSAVVSAVTDIGFANLTARFNGIPQAKVLMRQLKLLNPANREHRRLAVRTGLIAEDWANMGAAQMRFVGEVQGPEIMTRLSDGVLRASGLSVWTQTGRWAFGMEFMGLLADNAGKPFDMLAKPLREALTRYGISGDDWAVISKADIYEPDKGGFLRPDEVRVIDGIAPSRREALADKVLDMILSETEFAIPSASLRGRAAFTGGTKPGTIAGEMIRSTLMYKNFALTMFYTHLSRIGQQQGLWNAGKYAAGLFITTTLLGALALQLKEISKGRDPAPMNTASFWIAAMLQGGGLGIFGDFLLKDVNRFGQGLPETVAGPAVGFGGDLFRLTVGNLQEVASGDDTRLSAEVARMFKRYTPGGSLWYARLAFEREVIDQLQHMIDPNAKRAFRRAEQRLRADTGQRYFARPGNSLSRARAPDLAAAVE